MKNKTFFFYAVLIICFTLLSSGCGTGDKKQGKEDMGRAAYYNNLTNDAVSVTAKQLGLQLPEDRTVIYGFVSMQNVANVFVMISAAYATGESVDMSYGGNCFVITGDKGAQGGVSKLLFNTVKIYLKHYKADIEKYWKGKSEYEISQNLMMTSFITENKEDISKTLKGFIASLQSSVEIPKNADNGGLFPDAGEIKLVFLTNKGRFYVQDKTEEITRSEYAEIFKKRSDISSVVFQRFAPPPKTK